MKKILWKPNKELIEKSNLLNYEKFLQKNYNIKIKKNFQKLLNWSIESPGPFWDSIWSYCEIKGIKNKNFKFCKKIFNSKFFVNSKLNFAENLLSKSDNSKAITFVSENGFVKKKTWKQIYNTTSKVVQLLKKNEIKEKDRVAAYMPNIIETVECFLATTSIGAIWSSCSPDFGTKGVIERFSQIKPKILIMCDRYYYNGKEINLLNRLPDLIKNIKSIKKVIIINYPGKKLLNIKNFKNLKIYKWTNLNKIMPKKMIYKKFNFDHELVILYSSGTTGKPKCICHRAGGVLVQHLKEHKLHCNIKPGDNVFYFTTCGWMMWNWLISALASKASIVLFDGFPMFKNNELLFKIASKEKITLFGISAKYIDNLNKQNVDIKKKYKLFKLKTICSTGSPLSADGFAYIYKKIKSNVHLSSISGGTDIVSCFVLGNIYQPVLKGEIQNSGLGMNVDVYDQKGNSIKNKKGELVCKNSFPSMPLKFWNDKKKRKFIKTYFKKYKNIWHHGDFAQKNESNSFIIYGRSDATLNPGGVRLGTAEIYSIVEKFNEVKECIAVGQNWDNDVRIILFVTLNNDLIINDNLITRIKLQIRKFASPRHVPSKIIQVSDIPRTKNGKIVELAVKNVVEGNKIKNFEAIANPRVLDEFKNLKQLKY